MSIHPGVHANREELSHVVVIEDICGAAGATLPDQSCDAA